MRKRFVTAAILGVLAQPAEAQSTDMSRMSEEQGVAHIATLAETQRHEDLFAYVPGTGWHAIGAHQREARTGVDLTTLTALCARNDEVRIYHPHPLLSHLEDIQQRIGDEDHAWYWALDRRTRGLPSPDDIYATTMVEMHCRTAHPGIRMTHGIVSVSGEPLQLETMLFETDLRRRVLLWRLDERERVQMEVSIAATPPERSQESREFIASFAMSQYAPLVDTLIWSTSDDASLTDALGEGTWYTFWEERQ